MWYNWKIGKIDLVLVKTNKLVFSCINESSTDSGVDVKSNLPILDPITNFFNNSLIFKPNGLKLH